MLEVFEQRGITEPSVLRAFQKVQRERFVRLEDKDRAYADHALPIEDSQTISQPFIVALTVQALELTPTDRVLKIGTGSGYAACILAEICHQVFTVERRLGLMQQAQRRFQELGYQSISCRHSDAHQGWPEKAPFDAIAVAARCGHVPPALLNQLGDGGRLVIPVGPEGDQALVKVVRSGSHFCRATLTRVRFVPMLTGLA